MMKNIPDYRFLAGDICWTSKKINEEDYSTGKEILETIRRKPFTIAPLIILGGIIGSLNIANSILLSKITEIEPLNQEYEDLVSEINGYQKANNTLRSNTMDVRNLVNESINPIEFAANLQNAIPLTVQINNYEISSNNFTVEAVSLSQKDLDQFIVLLGNHPMIEQDSISIIELNASSNQSGIDTNSASQANNQYSVTLTANLKMLSSEESIDLILQSGNYGLLHKKNILSKGEVK